MFENSIWRKANEMYEWRIERHCGSWIKHSNEIVLLHETPDAWQQHLFRFLKPEKKEKKKKNK